MKNKLIKWIYFPKVAMDDITLTIYGSGAKSLIDILSKDSRFNVEDTKGIISNDKEWYWGKIIFPQSLAGEMQAMLSSAVTGTEHGHFPSVEYAVLRGDFPSLFELDSDYGH